MIGKNVLKKGPHTFYMKKVASGKLVEIEVCCNLGDADQKYSGKKFEKQKYKKYDDLK